MSYCVFAVGNNKKKNGGKTPHARRIKEKRVTEVAETKFLIYVAEVICRRRRKRAKRGIRWEIFSRAEQFSFRPVFKYVPDYYAPRARILRVALLMPLKLP